MDRWATFDCYGTLIDWNGGIGRELERLFGPARRAALHSYPRSSRSCSASGPSRAIAMSSRSRSRLAERETSRWRMTS
jgi:FMN phosphatase YigB (HAD superfamily)